MDKKEQLKKELEDVVKQIKEQHLKSNQNDNYQNLWNKMVTLAIELHKIVKPKHRQILIKNRGCSPDNPEFYQHIHAVESLLSYIENPDSNEDPKDITIGDEFKIRVYCRRWGHYDIYTIKRTLDGWEIKFISPFRKCNKKGEPHLFEMFKNDSINYPADLGGYIEWLWDKAHDCGLTHEEIQKAFDELGEWISICEKNSPTGIWESYK